VFNFWNNITIVCKNKDIESIIIHYYLFYHDYMYFKSKQQQNIAIMVWLKYRGTNKYHQHKMYQKINSNIIYKTHIDSCIYFKAYNVVILIHSSILIVIIKIYIIYNNIDVSNKICILINISRY